MSSTDKVAVAILVVIVAVIAVLCQIAGYGWSVA